MCMERFNEYSIIPDSKVDKKNKDIKPLNPAYLE